MKRLNEAPMSVETQEQIVTATQLANTGFKFKDFVKALVDEVYLGNDENNRINFLEDLTDCIEVTMSDSPEAYWNLDTIVREHFIDAYLRSQPGALRKLSEEKDLVSVSNVFEQINSGDIKVQWEGWYFSGGRDWGDWMRYTLSKSGKEIGYIDENISDDNYEVNLDGLTSEDIKITPELEKILMKALKRDDLQIVKKCTVNGELRLPADYGDISRADALTGVWVPNDLSEGKSSDSYFDSAADVFDQIKSGKIKVSWEECRFAGGKDWSDGSHYKLSMDGKGDIGFIVDNSKDVFYISFNYEYMYLNGEHLYAVENASERSRYRKILLQALKRDDSVFVKKCTVNGKLCLPTEYGTSRVDVLSGAWVPDCDEN